MPNIKEHEFVKAREVHSKPMTAAEERTVSGPMRAAFAEIREGRFRKGRELMHDSYRANGCFAVFMIVDQLDIPQSL